MLSVQVVDAGLEVDAFPLKATGSYPESSSSQRAQFGKCAFQLRMRSPLTHCFVLRQKPSSQASARFDGDIAGADLIIGHAGAGTILEALRARRKVVVVGPRRTAGPMVTENGRGPSAFAS